jgi:hypothetical protein
MDRHTTADEMVIKASKKASKQACSLIHHTNESKKTLVAQRQTHASLCLFGKWTATRCCGGVDSVIF